MAETCAPRRPAKDGREDKNTGTPGEEGSAMRRNRTGIGTCIGLAAALAAVLLLSGCGISLPRLTLNPQELYALPELPAKYTELNGLINDILSSGAEYAAPTSGANIQPVQLVDLNGDGQEEAVAFFRNPNDEKPLKIYIFTAQGDGYVQSDLIEGSGTAIYSIAYRDLDSDGRQELVVGWKATAELQVLEVYTQRSGSTEALLRTDYVKYAITDLSEDRRQELVVLRSGEDGDSVADYYSWQGDGSLSSRSSARISATMAELSQQGRVTQGMLRGDLPVLFVTGVTDQGVAVTDILTLRGGELANIALSELTGVTGVIAPFCSLYPMDIDGDGLTEVPCPVPMQTPWEENSYRQIEWSSYDENGVPALVMRTYHDLDDGWYLELPEAWNGQVYVSRSVFASESMMTFYTRAGEEDRPFLRIIAVTGTGREARAVRGGRFVLSRQPEVIYAAELLEGNDGWEDGVSEEQVRGAFNLIQNEWLLSSDS